jgi:hypothetical protein
MGFKIVEYYIRNIISDGIAELRKDVNLLDEIFGDLACPPLGDLYGHKIIDEIKCFFQDNDVPVLSAYGQNQIQLPSITVHLVSSQEDPELRTMQDHMRYERTPKRAATLAGPLHALKYDSNTGKLTFSQQTDMTKFIKNRKLFSRKDDLVYTLKGTFKINEAGTPAQEREEQYCHLVDEDGNVPENVDFAELYLLSSIDFALHRIALVHFRETFEIRVNAQTNSDQAIWLYYIVAYILMRNKHKFEEVGLESQTFSTSEFTRDVGKAPNSIWGRTLRFSFLVKHDWREEVDALEIVGVNVNVESNVTAFISGE